MVTVMEPPALYEPDCPANPAADSGDAELVTKLFFKTFFSLPLTLLRSRLACIPLPGTFSQI
jgi:hypothetical protein